jgi:hypothetical protein
MIVEEQGEAGGVVDSLNDTYQHLSKNSLTNGYFHEAPDKGDGHKGRVTRIEASTHGKIVGDFMKHIEDHGGTEVKGFHGDKKSLIMFKDGGQTRVASVSSSDCGVEHKMKIEH